MSPLLSLVSLLAKELRRDVIISPGFSEILPSSAKLQRIPPTKQNLPKAKDRSDRASLHSLFASAARVTPTISYLQAKSKHSPASFPAQWHDLRLAVHHKLNAEGGGTARPSSATCLLFPAMLLPPCVYPQRGHRLIELSSSSGKPSLPTDHQPRQLLLTQEEGEGRNCRNLSIGLSALCFRSKRS